jgi:hypothetical protein
LFYLTKNVAIPANNVMVEIRRRTFATIAQIRIHGAQKRKQRAIKPLKNEIAINAIIA